jgi:hypothetical protein
MLVKRSLIIVLVLMLVGASTGFAATLGTPISSRGIVPWFYAVGPGGNLTCGEVGDYDYASARFDDGAQYAGAVGPITWSTIDNTYVSWSGVHDGLAVIVKGGPGANVYFYDASYTWDSGLASPLNPGDQTPTLSNITFCWNEIVLGEWCSPGYWRQPHHLDSWEATGYSPDDSFFDALGYYPTVSKLGVKAGATTNPTLWQVLQSPQYYGGDAFNAVGDLLSAAHPDVNFLGIRVEDSCPLN